jgi:hypothetical protein
MTQTLYAHMEKKKAAADSASSMGLLFASRWCLEIPGCLNKSCVLMWQNGKKEQTYFQTLL